MLARITLAMSLLLACKPATAPSADTARPEPAAAPVVARPTAVFVVRHGEKADDDPRDPTLSPAGQARAGALATTLAHVGVTHLFTSEFRRTQATLRPLADAAKLEPVIIPAADQAALVSAIEALPAGSIVVVAGHSNTVPALVTALGGEARGTVASPAGPVLPDVAYDRLFLVIRSATGEVQTLELRQAH
ncbi:MAG TPA: phosphoglycerate mutase family protein [Nannocystis sp.]|jgi:phosphohistidine phosphatase SixA